MSQRLCQLAGYSAAGHLPSCHQRPAAQPSHCHVQVRGPAIQKAVNMFVCLMNEAEWQVGLFCELHLFVFLLSAVTHSR